MIVLLEYMITDKALIKTENFEPHFCFDYMNRMQVFAHAICLIHFSMYFIIIFLGFFFQVCIYIYIYVCVCVCVCGYETQMTHLAPQIFSFHIALIKFEIVVYYKGLLVVIIQSIKDK